jgi:hypothetical protein
VQQTDADIKCSSIIEEWMVTMDYTFDLLKVRLIVRRMEEAGGEGFDPLPLSRCVACFLNTCKWGVFFGIVYSFSPIQQTLIQFYFHCHFFAG